MADELKALEILSSDIRKLRPGLARDLWLNWVGGTQGGELGSDELTSAEKAGAAEIDEASPK